MWGSVRGKCRGEAQGVWGSVVGGVQKCVEV